MMFILLNIIIPLNGEIISNGWSTWRGGDGGNNRHTLSNPPYNIYKVCVRQGNEIDDIRVKWSDETLSDNGNFAGGNTGGTSACWQVPLTECIYKVDIQAGSGLDALRFVGTGGVGNSGFWGDPGGGNSYVAEGASNQCLTRIDVWEDNKVDKIRFYFQATPAPTKTPTSSVPTSAPTINPTPSPTTNPTPAPTDNPTLKPTDAPIMAGSPTKSPTDPTLVPSDSPTPAPTDQPTPAPTTNPTPSPTTNPTPSPTNYPTHSPTNYPTPTPTSNPISNTNNVTQSPTNRPSVSPVLTTKKPTLEAANPKVTYENGKEVTGIYETHMTEEELGVNDDNILTKYQLIIAAGIVGIILVICACVIIFYMKKIKKDLNNETKDNVVKFEAETELVMNTNTSNRESKIEKQLQVNIVLNTKGKKPNKLENVSSEVDISSESKNADELFIVHEPGQNVTDYGDKCTNNESDSSDDSCNNTMERNITSGNTAKSGNYMNKERNNNQFVAENWSSDEEGNRKNVNSTNTGSV
eukprot:262210_1